jgi:DivIVA domain-containing protein
MNRAFNLRDTRFPTVLGGLDPQDVDQLLERTADDYEAAHAALAALQSEHKRLSAELDERRDEERGLSRVVLKAEEEAQYRRAAADGRGVRAIVRAEQQAQELLKPYENERAAIEWEIQRLLDRRERAMRLVEEAIAGIQHELTHTPEPEVADDLADDDFVEIPEAENAEREQDVEAAVPSLTPAPMPPADTEPEQEAAFSVAPVSRHMSRANWVLAAAAVVALGVGARLFLPERSSGDRDSQAPAIAAGVALPERSKAASVERRTAASSASRPDANRAEPNEPSPTAPSASAEPAKVPEASTMRGLSIQLDAARDCWIRISVDGRSESRLLEAGTSITRTSNNAIDLRVGDAGAVTLSINGIRQPPLGRNGEVVNRRVQKP